jgi:hypothetical protein
VRETVDGAVWFDAEVISPAVTSEIRETDTEVLVADAAFVSAPNIGSRDLSERAVPGLLLLEVVDEDSNVAVVGIDLFSSVLLLLNQVG